MAYDTLRRIYHRVRPLPIIGPAVQALRNIRIPRWKPGHKYETLHALVEAQGHAIEGLRRGLGRIEHHQNELEERLIQFQSLHERGAQRHAELEDVTQQLAARVEFVRSELLYEMRYAPHQPSTLPSAAGNTPITPRLIAADKLADQRRAGAIRLNLGCGHKPLPEYLNVDRRELPGVDLVADVDHLPFEPGEIREIHAAHLLEHFPEEYLRRRLLPYWRELLAPGGTLRLIVPDAEAMIAAWTRGELDFPTLRLITFGAQDYEGDFHYTMFTPDTLCQLLIERGFSTPTILARARPNGLCLECDVEATRP